MVLATPERDVAYYTVADSSFFPGAVALLNSLRRVGEQAPLYVVDCGLTAEQRKRLSTRATVVPRHEDLHPQLQKATGPLAHPAKIMVFIDADILVTRPLAPLLAEAEAGQIVAFRDIGNPDRFFEEWSSPELGQAQRRPYVNSGFFAFSWDTARELLPLFVELQGAVDMSATYHYHGRGGSPSHPTYFPDQDVLNALLCTRFDGRVTRLEGRLAPFPPFDGVRLIDGDKTLCVYPDGVAPFALHHISRKPWLAPLQANAYSRLFTVLVTDPRTCVQLDRRELPLRLTNRPFASVDRWRASMQFAARQRLRGKLHIRPKIARLRARSAA
jgi:hypothetical protein